MATVSTLFKSGSYHTNPWSAGAGQAYWIENIIDLADAATAKGSALAQGDIIQVLTVPAGSLVVFAGFQVMTAMTGTSTDTTLDFGVTGGNVDAFVDGFDLDGAAAGAYATVASTAVSDATFISTADTLDLLIATQTGTITGGKLRFYAHILPCDSRDSDVGIALVGS